MLVQPGPCKHGPCKIVIADRGTAYDDHAIGDVEGPPRQPGQDFKIVTTTHPLRERRAAGHCERAHSVTAGFGQAMGR